MSEEVLLQQMEIIVLALLFVALGIFIAASFMKKRVKSFHVSISLFLLIWIIGEIVHYFTTPGRGIIENNTESWPIEDLGMIIHAIAMVVFAIIMWTRYYTARKAGKNMIETLDSILK
ncbi:MAG: hypothetical protein ACPKQO_03675 [Nitrososphaeraceae archaeon]